MKYLFQIKGVELDLISINSIIGIIKSQDKEFIKRLKEGFKQRVETNIEIRDIDEGTLFAWEIDEIIDKLAGEELS